MLVLIVCAVIFLHNAKELVKYIHS